MEKRQFRVPHTLVLLFAMVIAAVLLTYILPAGSYERVENEHGREQVVPGTFHATPEVEAPSPLAVFTSIPRGLEAAGEIIFFIFIIGGAFAVLRATGTVDAMLAASLRRLGHRPLWLVLGGMLVFVLGSSTIGMAEEYLPFVPVLVALALALGYDAIVGVAIITIGYSIGYGVAALNPFTVLIAQDVAGLQPASGLGFRLALLLLFVPIGMHHVWRYASRVKRDPSSSLVADIAPPVLQGGAEETAFTRTHRLVLAAVMVALAVLVYGLARWGWYLVEMGALFLGLAVVMAALGRIHPDEAAKTFTIGAAELTGTALLVGFARSIQVVLEQGGVIDTIVHGLSVPLQTLPPALAAVGMFLVQTMTNLFIPSGSGQAYVTMPIMAPLADVVGVTRQVAVLAYQFGDGFSNIIVPTNPVIIGILAIAGIPYDRWLRFVVPFMLKVLVAGSFALVVAVWLGVS
ncbi:MAG TPA: Na+/H+ antiporter NhaC family protein [Longimicrobiales bacterium]|nr:Na+/H+ antiporter NhaC family protein [Longimicrobiales bacterium]